MKSLLSLLLLFSFSTLLSGQIQQGNPLVLKHVTVIDCTGGPLLPDMTVLINDGRIREMGPSNSVTVPSGASIVNGAGKFLIPGLWEMHTHLQDGFPGAGSDEILPLFFSLYIANGVTGIRDMGGRNVEWIVQKRKEVMQGARLGPRIFTGGQALDGPRPTDSTKLPVPNAAAGREAVIAQKRRGADFVKIYDGLSREAYLAIANQCARAGIAFTGHIPPGISAEEASNAGQRTIEHLGLGRVREACYVNEEDAATPVPDPDPKTTAVLKTILLSIWKGNYDSALLTPDLDAWLSSNAAKNYLRNLDAEQGSLHRLEFRRKDADGTNTLYYYKAVYQKKTRCYMFLLAEDRKFNLLPDEPGIYSEPKAAALFATFKKNQTWQCPTLTALHRIAYRSELMNDPRLKYVPPLLRSMLNPRNDPRYKNWTSAEWDWFKRTYRLDSALIGKMRRAGVEFLAGTDAILDFCVPGFSLHDELSLLVEAGLTPMESLQAATRNPARFFGIQDDLGTIEKGKMADLVLLDANPLEEIRNTQKINAVIVKGRLLDRKALDELLAQAEAAASGR